MSNPLKKIGKALKGFVSSIGNFVKKHWKKILVIGAMVAAPYLATQMASATGAVSAAGSGMLTGAGTAGSLVGGSLTTAPALVAPAATGAAATGAAGAVTTGVTGLGSAGGVPLVEGGPVGPGIGSIGDVPLTGFDPATANTSMSFAFIWHLPLAELAPREKPDIEHSP